MTNYHLASNILKLKIDPSLVIFDNFASLYADFVCDDNHFCKFLVMTAIQDGWQDDLRSSTKVICWQTGILSFLSFLMFDSFWFLLTSCMLNLPPSLARSGLGEGRREGARRGGVLGRRGVP